MRGSTPCQVAKTGKAADLLKLNITTMSRVKIENSSNWFDPNKAILKIKEETFWNGHNWISKATGDQFTHESIYYTKSGRFVINRWSDYQGGADVCEEINENEVAEWLIKNEFEDLEELISPLPQSLQNKVLKVVEDLEI